MSEVCVKHVRKIFLPSKFPHLQALGHRLVLRRETEERNTL